MKTIFVIVGIWVAVSIPLSLVVARLIHRHNGEGGDGDRRYPADITLRDHDRAA